MTKLEKTRASKVHQRYFVDGVQVPGVTTVINVLNKPALVGWANRIGLEGIAVGAYVDSLAAIGSGVHAMIEARLKGEDFDAGDYTPNEMAAAQGSVAKYEEWAKGKSIKVVGAEVQMVSAKYRFGGTADALLEIDGVLTVVDLKTGKGIYPEHLYQVAAYAELAIENGHDVKAIRILNIPRAESEAFAERVATDWKLEWAVFYGALQVYDAQRAIKWKKEEAA